MQKLLTILVVIVLVVVVVGLTVDPAYDLSASIVIDAPSPGVHAYVGDLAKWPTWAPWHEADPTIKITFGATTTGVGASQTWTSADGDGELTFTASDPTTGIAYDMAFVMDGERFPSKSAMTYAAAGGGTEVTWSMTGTWKGAVPPVLDGWMSILSPFTIGSMFDDGLANLKRVVEAKG